MRLRWINVWVLLLIASWAAASAPATRPFPGVDYVHEMRKDPPQQLHIVSIDLANPRISLHVVRAADPDGDGPWQTTMQRTTTLAAENQLDLAVNGDFFGGKDKKTIAGKTVTYYADNWAYVTGMAMSDGKLWSDKKGRFGLVVHADGHITIEMLNAPPPTARQIIGGSHQLVVAGKFNISPGGDRAPRTAAGIDASGKKLTLLVVDGRQNGYAAGMTLRELTDELLRLGCQEAINLDGGGSTALVFRQDGGNGYKIMNRPSDGSNLPVPMSVERPVANAFGVRIGPAPEPVGK
jgi:hypothetical protein